MEKAVLFLVLTCLLCLLMISNNGNSTQFGVKSQVCGHNCDANRPNKGLLFVCQNCHYTLHADLVGARNTTMRTLLVRQDWMRTGHLSFAPESSDSDVSSVEAKAARLARFAELRWSLDTSPE